VIHRINEFNSTYGVFQSILMDICTVDFYINSCVQILEIHSNNSNRAFNDGFKFSAMGLIVKVYGMSFHSQELLLYYSINEYILHDNSLVVVCFQWLLYISVANHSIQWLHGHSQLNYFHYNNNTLVVDPYHSGHFAHPN